MLDPLLLRHFVTVAELSSFSRAAETLNTSQSVISRSVKRLEDLVGARLIERSTRSMTLTVAGEALLSDALDILNRLAVAIDNARRLGSDDVSVIRLAICPTTESREIACGIAAFREQWPAVNLTLQALMSDEQPQALRASQIDVGIMVNGEPSYSSLKWRVVARPWLGVAVPRAWNFPQNKPCELKDLADRPIIMPERAKAPEWYDGIVNMCKRAGFQPQIGGVAEDPVIARIMIAAGFGALFVHSRGESGIHGEIHSMPLAGDPVFLPGETVVAWADGADAPQIMGLVDCLATAWGDAASQNGFT